MSEQPKNPIVHQPCKRGMDRSTEGQSCKGRKAEKLSPNGSQVVQFKCVDCGFTWTIAVGGAFHL